MNPASRRIYLVADRAQAHFYQIQAGDPLAPSSRVKLVRAAESLFNPLATGHDAELWSDRESGANQGGGQTHAYDDHREQHQAEYLKRFVEEVCEQASKLLEAGGSLALVADSTMLGVLRACVSQGSLAHVEQVELNKNLASLPVTELQEHLSKAGLF